jgi:hypothetical protein
MGNACPGGGHWAWAIVYRGNTVLYTRDFQINYKYQRLD